MNIHYFNKDLFVVAQEDRNALIHPHQNPWSSIYYQKPMNQISEEELALHNAYDDKENFPGSNFSGVSSPGGVSNESQDSGLCAGTGGSISGRNSAIGLESDTDSTVRNEWPFSPTSLEYCDSDVKHFKDYENDYGWNTSEWGREFISVLVVDEEEINRRSLSGALSRTVQQRYDGSYEVHFVRNWIVPGGRGLTPIDGDGGDFSWEALGDVMFQRHKASVDLDESLRITNARLAELSKRTGMPITQENGQRRYGPPLHSKSAPPKGSEVFVGKLPRDCIEPEIVPVFEKVGKIYEIRMMMDFSGTNRGYCFIQYHQPSEAARAVRELNHFEIRTGRFIGVTKSVDNCRLFLGGIPTDKTDEQIFLEISRITEDVVKVICYPSPRDRKKNRGFAFVEYQSHKAAAMARRKMIPGKIQMWGTDVAVDWAEPEPDVDIEIMNKVKALYVRNLLVETEEKIVENIFNAASKNGVERIKKPHDRDYAFIHFVSREAAELAKHSLDRTLIDGVEIEVRWAKPLEDRNNYLAKKALARSLYPSPGGGYKRNYPNPPLLFNSNNAFFNNPYAAGPNNLRMMAYQGYPMPMGENYGPQNGVGSMQPFGHNSRVFQPQGYQNFQQVGLGDHVGMQQNGIAMMPNIMPQMNTASASNNNFEQPLIQQFQRLNFGPDLRPSRGRAAGGVQGMRFNNPNQQMYMNPCNIQYGQKYQNLNNGSNCY